MRPATALLLSAVFLLAAACGTAAPPPPKVAATSLVDDAVVAGLPGYRAQLISAPVFGGEVFVLEVGQPEAPVVVLVHGLGETGCRDFYPILPALAAQAHVITFDLPGFGRSTHANEPYTPERYADFMHALLGQRVHGPFNLVGHSMGGAIALDYAARYPKDVARLLLIDVAGILHRRAYVNFAAYAGIANVLGVLSKPIKQLGTVVEESTETVLGPLLPGTPDPSVVLRNPALRATVLGSPLRIAALATILEDFAPTIAAVQAPAWILWGSDDAAASPRTGLILQARLPAARLTVLDGGGHDPMASRPAAVDKILREALASPLVAPVARTEPAFPPLPARQGHCDGQDGMVFSGDYAEIAIAGCREAVLRDVRTGALRIRDSYVIVENTRVVAQDVALDVRASRVEITASDFTGEVALAVAGSDLDLAGVALGGKRASVRVGGATKLICSVSRVDSPVGQRYLHDVYQFDIGAEL